MIIRTVETQLLYWDGQFVNFRRSFLPKYPPIAPAQIENTPRCYFGAFEDNNEEDTNLLPKNRGANLSSALFTRNVLMRGEPLCRHSFSCIFVFGS